MKFQREFEDCNSRHDDMVEWRGCGENHAYLRVPNITHACLITHLHVSSGGFSKSCQLSYLNPTFYSRVLTR